MLRRTPIPAAVTMNAAGSPTCSKPRADTFEFRASPACAELIRGVDLLRELNETASRHVPDDAPIGFVRRFYELYVLSEMSNALRSATYGWSAADNLRTSMRTSSFPHLCAASVQRVFYRGDRRSLVILGKTQPAAA